MKFQLNNEETTFNICRSMRQSGEFQSVSAISYKENMKKHHDLKLEKGDLMTDPYLVTQLFPHGQLSWKPRRECGLM